MADNEISEPELTAESVLRVADDYFTADNVAIITGAASGIGRATAVATAMNGLTTVATDVDDDGLAGTAEKAQTLDTPGEVHTVEADLTSDADLESMVETAADLGDIKYLANIAGIQHIDPIESFPIDTYDTMHEIMLRAPLALSKLCIPHIKESEDGVGAIGNMSSVHGHYVTQDKVAYNIMKFGLRGLSQSIAAEGDGALRSFSISTAYVKTPLVTNQIADTAAERGISEREVVEDVMLGQARVKEMMDPIDVGNLFVLGFSRHGRHLDGGDLLFDGGYTLTYE
ncbi:MAG: SDR family oxidoreductase [Halorientalis sp.]